MRSRSASRASVARPVSTCERIPTQLGAKASFSSHLALILTFSAFSASLSINNASKDVAPLFQPLSLFFLSLHMLTHTHLHPFFVTASFSLWLFLYSLSLFFLCARFYSLSRISCDSSLTRCFRLFLDYILFLGDTAASQSTNNNSSSRGCFFEGDKQFHGAGTKWHPYLPPFGFDRCSLCTCRVDTLNITCQRNVACPPLSCPEYEAFRENPMDCCKRCPVVVPVKAISTDQLGDQRSSSVSNSPNELLAGGGEFKWI